MSRAPFEGPIEVCRRGTALRAGRRVLRRVDLELALGRPEPDAPRFAAASLAGDRVEIEFADGSREAIPAHWFEDPSGQRLSERRADLVVENAGLLMTAEEREGDPLGLFRDGALITGGDRILWVGTGAELAGCGFDLSGAERLDAGGRLVTPGLIDCHAHPLFAGNRAEEYGMRAAGRGYLEIAEAGGGIVATVESTRRASFDEHVRLASARMKRALASGTTTCEAKSGYDLTVDGELRLLEVALVVDALQAVDLDPTLLGAHALPPERKDDRDGFVADVADQMVPRAAERGLARAVDVYCDKNAFTLEETRRIFEAARRAKLLCRGHVGQFADLGGPQLLAELGGLSADHLEQVSPEGMRAMAAHGVAAVMLPGACVQLRMQPPPVAELREAGVTLALATDMNPGTTRGETLPIQMWLATTHYGMTVEEAWLGVTRHAARVLARPDIGVLTPGALADLVLWDAEHPAEIPYCYDARLVERVIKAGRPV